MAIGRFINTLLFRPIEFMKILKYFIGADPEDVVSFINEKRKLFANGLDMDDLKTIQVNKEGHYVVFYWEYEHME